MLKICNTIDAISRSVSNAVSLLFVPLTLIATYEVVMRYAFNSPTTWAWDVNVQLFLLIVVMGSANLFLVGGHVSMDIISDSVFTGRVKQIVSVCLTGLLIFVVGVLVWQAGEFAWRSFLLRERTSTLLHAPIFPLKIAMFCGLTLLWAQVISVFLRQLVSVVSPEEKAR